MENYKSISNSGGKYRARAGNLCFSPSGMFYAEIHSGDMRLGLRTFKTAYEAARVYDAS